MELNISAAGLMHRCWAVSCGRCGAAETIHDVRGVDVTRRAAERLMENAGWSRIEDRWYCARCAPKMEGGNGTND